MKILFLLFAVVFLVLMDAPGFSQAQLTRKECLRRAGSCYLRRCPTRSLYLARCHPRGVCCRKWYD